MPKHGIFLGFSFLVRNEEKNVIPREKTRKFRGIAKPFFLPVEVEKQLVCTIHQVRFLSVGKVLLFFVTH